MGINADPYSSFSFMVSFKVFCEAVKIKILCGHVRRRKLYLIINLAIFCEKQNILRDLKNWP